MNNNSMSNENQNEDFDLRSILEKYLIHWKWFVFGAFFCVSFAYVYLRYSTPQYQASTTILVKDENKGGMLSELSAFSDMGLGNASMSNLDNEIEILKSRTLVERTVKTLKLNVSMINHGNVVSREVYKVNPIVVDFVNLKPDFYTSSFILKFVSLTPETFAIENEVMPDETKVLTSKKKEFRYGEIISTLNGDLIITKSLDKKNQLKPDNVSIDIRVSPLDGVVGDYLGRVKINPVSKTSSVVVISMTDPITKRAEDFLDNLIQIYNNDAAADKNFISENTSKFISSRLILITQELDGVEQDVESFKKSNNLTDIESEAELFINGSSEYNKKSVENEIQLNVVSSMLDFLKKSTNADLLPTNIISVEGGDTSELINTYNKLVLERNRILKSATVANPSVVKLDQQIVSLKSNVLESLGRLQASLNIQKRNLKNQEGLLNAKIGKIPVQERQFRVIARQQKVKEELYLYLLQKREETAISLAATEPNARVIDAAKASSSPVSPKKNRVYMAAFLLGLLIPFGILYLKNLLDTKVKNRFDITGKLAIPYLGDIPHSSSPDKLIDATSRSRTAEALRIVQTNLDFMLNQVAEGSAKTIFLTSTIPGEGKTFLAVNLAGTIALTGKKVLLLGMDIRDPKLKEYLQLPNSKGLTDYLSSNKVSISDCIFKSKDFENLSILPAGIIPPNPTELLMNKKVGELFDQLKKEYDFIIVDTAPVSIVSDTLMLAKYADTTVYVVRVDFLDKRMLYIPKLLYTENKLNNMAVVLNATHATKGHSYGYDYGAPHEKKSWYKKIFNK
ncbi:MAG: polysaccharide biosynthesis tyrosine autokinase [Leadbetterella sp.]|nr:polysaccharide biosynthesis tyrosine autokinase [Leadbetterella sp.]